jgi:hypothetical protein
MRLNVKISIKIYLNVLVNSVQSNTTRTSKDIVFLPKKSNDLKSCGIKATQYTQYSEQPAKQKRKTGTKEKHARRDNERLKTRKFR